MRKEYGTGRIKRENEKGRTEKKKTEKRKTEKNDEK
jgi:hypothetical protein